MIEFTKVTKKFGEITAVEDLNFVVNDQDFVFITGPSGAGKTTIVKLILRQYLPTSGAVKVDKQDLKKFGGNSLAGLRRKIGVVFQDLKLLVDQTVFENVAMALRVQGWDEKTLKKEILEVLDLVGLSRRATLFPAQLAGGELQRACLARAVVSQPKIIIADEPTGNLDPTTAWQIVKLLKKIHRQGKTVIMCTHNFEIVNSMRERVILLNEGKLVSDKKQGRYKNR